MCVALAALLGGAWIVGHFGVAPRLAGLFIERRSSGHTEWIAHAGRFASGVLQDLDRGGLALLPSLPKWAGASMYAASATPPAKPLSATTPEEIADAMAKAQPGDTILIGPGRYRFSGSALQTGRAGTPQGPITVKAQVFGTAVLEFAQLEGFRVTAPYWRFEDLVIQGACPTHDVCEHALHVVGGAHHVTIRNNVIRDFNAHIKINGEDGRFPDAGQVMGNTLTNQAPRRADKPVTPVDLVAASRWQIEGNLIADFIKEGGDTTSYGAFAKGAGAENRFVRNVVLCEARLRGRPGRRIGLSLGGGGSDASNCRDGRCIVEQQGGLIVGNLIAGCSDDGVYVNRSPGSKILHNTLLDTAGIELRFPESVATLAANLVDGPIRVRDQAVMVDEGANEISPVWGLYAGWHPVRDLFADAATLDLRFKSRPRGTAGAEPQPDLCKAETAVRALPGAFDDIRPCERKTGR